MPEIMRCGRVPRLRNLPPMALGDDFPAMNARARPEINDVVGTAHGVLVMFDDEQGIALGLQ
ncbi:hypothetical protein QPK87_30345 [Kamptonema cortianum]|nr:hypothetical protein [Kamptonema cortianum]